MTKSKGKKEEDLSFEIGEKVIEDIYDMEGVVKQITLRDASYVYRHKYLVEFTKKTWFGKEKKYTKWMIGYSLRKIIK